MDPNPPSEEWILFSSLRNEWFELDSTQTYYLLSKNWFDVWENYSKHHRIEKPGKIDNEDLISDSTLHSTQPQLKLNLLEDEDYIVLSYKEWEYLHNLYAGGPALPRGVVIDGNESRSIKRLEVYLVNLELRVFCPNTKTLKVPSTEMVYMSKYTTIGHLKDQICDVLNFDKSVVRLWNFLSDKEYEVLNDLDHTLDEEGISFGQKILIEYQETYGIWPLAKNTTTWKQTFVSLFLQNSLIKLLFYFIQNYIIFHFINLFGDITESYAYDLVKDGDFNRGICGLRNLGNTCFMNSSLQCLSNTIPLRDYFINNNYKKDINKNNPIGMKGNIAEKYGELLKEMWCGNRRSVSPKALKSAISKWAPQFEGYNQHDSQELLSFLLDGLHEDLNQVSKKPYYEIDIKGLSDKELAQESWKIHTLRNKSAIVNMFHGQLKSTVTCPQCGKVSITFDPFMYLSIPLKREDKIPVSYTKVVSLSKGYHRKTTVMESRSTVSDFKTMLESNEEKREQLLVLEVSEGRVLNVLEDDFPLSSLKPYHDLYVFYMVHKDWNPVIVYQRKLELGHRDFGLPFIIEVAPDNLTHKDLYISVSKQLDALEIKKGHSRPRKSTKNSLNNNFGFELKATVRHGLRCICEDMDCYGCVLGLEEEALEVKDFENFRLCVDWDEDYDFEKRKCITEEKAKDDELKEISLSDCISLFAQTERLGKNNSWYCSDCKEHQRALKKLDLWKLPEILVIHLKRFHFNRYSKAKLSTLVNFPLTNLNLDKFIINNDQKGQLYNLYAVSNHSGGLHGGHYTAYAKNSFDDKWYFYNDESVSLLKNQDDIVSNAAYTLFYQRV